MRKPAPHPRVAHIGSLEPRFMDPCLVITQERTWVGARRSAGICTSGIRGLSSRSMSVSAIRPTRWASATADTYCSCLQKRTPGTALTCPKSSTLSPSPSAWTSCEHERRNSPLTSACEEQAARPLDGPFAQIASSQTKSTPAHAHSTWATRSTSGPSCVRRLAGRHRNGVSRTLCWISRALKYVERSPWRLNTREAPSRVGEGLRDSGCNRFSSVSHRVLMSSLWRERIFRGSVLRPGGRAVLQPKGSLRW